MFSVFVALYIIRGNRDVKLLDGYILLCYA
jgi:hypothetical protein